MIRQIKCLMVYIILLGFAACQGENLNQLTIKAKNNYSEPSETVLAFFNAESEKEVYSLVRPYPDKFVDCLFMSEVDCTKKRQKSLGGKDFSKERTNDNHLISIEESEISVLVEDYKQKIRAKQLFLKQVKSEWTINDESRVRVELNSMGKQLIKDVLLYKDNKWQIIEIANENEHLYYAKPSETNKIY